MMKNVLKGNKSAGFGKIAFDILISEKPAAQNLHDVKTSVHKPLLREAKTQSITDRWLQNAMAKQTAKYPSSTVVLHLPIVLKTLQRLRSSDNRASFFKLLNKIKSSRIQWISQTGKYIKNDGKSPLELFHEVSNMLYRMAIMDKHAKDSELLAKFVLQLMTSYQEVLRSSSINNLQQTTKFYRNCLMIIVKTESIGNLLAAFEQIPAECVNLRCLAEIAFYQQSDQVSKALDYLEEKFLSPGSAPLSSEEVIAFFPLFFTIMQTCIVHGEQQTCCNLLGKLANDWKYEMDDHHYTLLVELCEKYATDKAHISLGQAYPHYSNKLVPWKSLQSEMSWEQFITFLYKTKVNLFKENQDLDFLQHKLSTVGSTTQEWQSFLEKIKVPEDANSSLKAFIINSVLIYLVANRNLGFFMSVLEYLIYEKNYGRHFLDSQKLVGQSKYSNFHILFKAIANSSSSILTACELFKFLEKNPQLAFKFTTNDFYCMMKTCVAGANHHALYFFLFQYILTKGHTFFVESGTHRTWVLPSRIKLLLKNCVFGLRGDRRAIEITDNVGEWFMKRSLEAEYVDSIDEATLKNIFGSEYLPNLDMNTLLSLERKYEHEHDITNEKVDRSGYSLSVDMQKSRRINRLLEHIIKQSSVEAPESIK